MARPEHVPNKKMKQSNNRTYLLKRLTGNKGLLKRSPLRPTGFLVNA